MTWDIVLNELRGTGFWSITLRLVLSVVFAGFIGMERESKNQAAGFRTYILVCLGSCLTMITNIHVCQLAPDVFTADASRIAASVVSGIGFLGAGTIIVTGRHKVRGLTTAAGLWASACMGLAIGIGFYEAAVAACALIWFVTSALHRLDGYVMAKSKVVELYVEFGSVGDISGFISRMRSQDIRISEMDITRNTNSDDSAVAAMMVLRSVVKRDHAEILAMASDVQGVKFVESI